MKIVNLKEPFKKETLKNIEIGDKVLVTGKIYMARDAAHKKMVETLKEGGKLPFDIENQIIYYAGPCPTKPGEIIGSCGPTTSGRMDKYAPTLMKLGLLGMIGKGERNDEVKSSITLNNAIYLGAVGGLGALLANHIKSVKVVAYEELGAEALRELYVENFPTIVLYK